MSGAEAKYCGGDFLWYGGVGSINPAVVGGGIHCRPWPIVVPLLPVSHGLLPDSVSKPGGRDGDGGRSLSLSRQLGQHIGLLVSGDAGVSGYTVYSCLYSVGSEGERHVSDQGCCFQSGATVAIC
jgi:hypothetical protein